MVLTTYTPIYTMSSSYKVCELIALSIQKSKILN